MKAHRDLVVTGDWETLADLEELCTVARKNGASGDAPVTIKPDGSGIQIRWKRPTGERE